MSATLFECKWKKAREDRNTITDDDKCLPEELLFQDILFRLPIKPLLRFKSVSKRWRNLIRSPSFITSHRRYHFRGDSWGKLIQTPYSDAWKYTYRDSETEEDVYTTSYSPLFAKLIDPYHHPVLPPEILIDLLEFPYPEEDSNPDSEPWTRCVSVLGPLNNGIYCIIANLEQHIKVGPIGFRVFRLMLRLDTCKIAFCNPGTRDYKFVNPFPSEMVRHLMTYSVGSSDLRVNYGFGSVDMDGIIPHDYKVVVILSRRTSFLSLVYSHRRGTWETLVDYEMGKRDFVKPKVIDGIAARSQGSVQYPKMDEDFMICSQGFFNGCWHWMAWKPNEHNSIVLSFHMGDEVFKFFGGAPGYLKGRIIEETISYGSVSVLNHQLAAFYYTGHLTNVPESIFDVWMMMEYGVEESWTKIYTVHRMCPIFKRLGGIKCSVRDDCVGGIQIEKILYRDNTGKLISCDDSVVEHHGLLDFSASIYWNTLGFSAYSQTLEPVTISVEEDDSVVANSG